MTGPSPVDRARLGSKHSLLVDGSGIPLAVTLTSGNRNDVTQLLPLIDGVGPVARPAGPGGAPTGSSPIAAMTTTKYRRELCRRGVKPVIARRGTEHGSRFGEVRWVVERTFAWLHQCRRLRLRWERRLELYVAFLMLGCALICWRQLTKATGNA